MKERASMAMLSGIVGLKSLTRAAISCRMRCTIQASIFRPLIAEWARISSLPG